MLVSFRQTYGDERWKLYEILSKDKRMIEFYNMCDLNIQSFHNCSKKTIEYFNIHNKIKNNKQLIFNNISYTDCISEMKKELKKVKTAHFFWAQDDSFSDNNKDVDLNELIEYVKSHKLNFMLNLAHNKEMMWIEYPVEEHKTFNILKASTISWSETGRWSMDDSPYICTVDIIDEIYDETFLTKYFDVWKSEEYLNEKYKKIKLPRYLLDKQIIFKNYNILGRTTWKAEYAINKLIEKELL